MFAAQSDVLGAELARKLAFQEQQATEDIAEVHRLSATFQRGSPLFAKAQVRTILLRGRCHSELSGCEDCVFSVHVGV